MEQPIRKLSGLFPNPASQSHGEMRAMILSFILGLVLLLVKMAAYIKTGSEAIFSDALENVVNVLTSGFAVYAVHVSHRPADPEHPYGHGKIEFLSASFEGGMIVLAAFVIIGRSLAALARHETPQDLDFGMVLVTAAMLFNGGMGMWLVVRGKRHNSIVLEADGIHLLSDAITSAAVIFALLLVKATGWSWADPLAASAIAIYIIFMGLGLLRKAGAGLMDEQDVADNKTLCDILDSHLAPRGAEPQICSYHRLKHRHSGRFHWVDFHIRVPADWNVQEGHRVATAIEKEMETALADASATAHVEPCDKTTCPTCRHEMHEPAARIP